MNFEEAHRRAEGIRRTTAGRAPPQGGAPRKLALSLQTCPNRLSPPRIDGVEVIFGILRIGWMSCRWKVVRLRCYLRCLVWDIPCRAIQALHRRNFSRGGESRLQALHGAYVWGRWRLQARSWQRLESSDVTGIRSDCEPVY